VALLCPHKVDLVNFNCEKCAQEHAVAHPQDRKPFPEEPKFRIYRGEDDWVCELDCYTGHGKTIGRAIDAAITIGLGLGRTKSLKEWIDSHYYVISALSAEAPEEGSGE